MRLTENFRVEEFRCPCGCGGEIQITARLVVALQALRGQLGVPLIVTSGFRCLEFNRSIGSADTSQHVLGRAADVQAVQGLETYREPQIIGHKAESIGAFRTGGIGIYNNFVHLDVRPDGPARWDLPNKGLGR